MTEPRAPDGADAAAAAGDGHLVERHESGQTLLEGGFLEVRRDTVVLPDGQRTTREYIQHPGAVAVLPLLDDGRAVLVRQFRYPVAKVLLEIPAGKRDEGESVFATAARELAEETGYSAREWAFGGEIHNAAAYSTESIWIWFARGLVEGAARPDHGEFVETVRMSADEMEARSLAGELPDVKTQIALAWWLAWRDGRRPLTWLGTDEAARR